MPLKYIIQFVDFNETGYLIEIDSPDYSGTPIQLTPSSEPLVIEYNGNNDDDIFKTHVIPSSATIQVVSENLDISELLYINDASYKVRIHQESMGAYSLYWSGWIVSDGIQEVDSGVPYDVTLRAIDGLELMDNVVLSWDNYVDSLVSVNGQIADQRSPINAFRVALFKSNNLDNPLTLYWNTSIENDHYPDRDMMAGATRINPRGEVSMLNKTCAWWVDNLSKSAISWLYQSNGSWYLNNYFDSLNGQFNGWVIGSYTTVNQPATFVDDVSVSVVDATDTRSNTWFWFGKKPYGSVSVLYNDAKFPENNALPNGGFDTTITGVVADWYAKFSNATLYSESPINQRQEGFSLEVDNLTANEDYVTFGSIPIDTETLYKNATLGFIWMPILGYDLTSEGAIDFSKHPLHISVSLDIGGTEYFLNEFGFWTDKNLPANAQVTSYGIVIDVDGPEFRVQFDPAKNFQPGDEVRIYFTRGGVDTGYFVKFDTVMAVQDGIDYVVTKIPSSERIGTNTLAVTGASNNPSWQNAYTVKVTNYYRKIEIDGGNQLRPNDALSIAFQSKGGDTGIKLPSGLGRLSFEIYSKPGSKMRLDDAYFTVNDAHDVYKVAVPNTKNSDASYEMSISSGFSGNMVTSYGDGFATRDESMFWNSGKTLTELYARAIMDTRNRGIRVFSGEIDKLMSWGLFSLMGKTYAPLSMRLNVRECYTSVVGAEFTPSALSYNVTHKSNEGG